MPKSFRGFISLVLLFSVIIFSFSIQPAGTARIAVDASSSGGAVSVWYDALGDLWVANDFYTWNITSGHEITLHKAGTGSARALTPATSANVISGLLLSPPELPALQTRILFALPQAASVWVQSGPQEGIVLNFRAEDALVTLAYRGSPGSVPTSLQALPFSTPAGFSEALGEFGVQPVSSGEGSLSYQVRFDPQTHISQALLIPPARASSAPARTGPLSCLNPDSPDCQDLSYRLPGEEVGRSYLLLYAQDAANPLAPIHRVASQLQLEMPDLNVASIARLPRYAYDVAKNKPALGDAVTFEARIANRGQVNSPAFQYIWRIDGIAVSTGTHPGLVAGQLQTLSLPWTWQTGAHTVSLTLDTTALVSEVSETNNQVTDRTDALAIGFWVEQSVYDYFNLNQVSLGLGSVSWDDFAQRQVSVWNNIFTTAINPLTPQGVLDRVRLDKVTVVPDGSLPNPYPSNYPVSDDKSVDMIWGFPSELVGVPSTHPQYGPLYLDSPEAQNVEYSLMHELSHARYLDDLYAINISIGRLELLSAITAASTSMTVNYAAGTGDFNLPAKIQIGGELVICQSASGNTFTACQRGAGGTTPRSHAAGVSLHHAVVPLTDGSGNLVQGSPALPAIGFDDHLYYNRYGADMMNGGQVLLQHSAYAWNKIAGQRPVCGNYNAPCNIGDYQDDSPLHNILVVANGKAPVANATVEVYSAQPFTGVYNGEEFFNTPDVVLTTNAAGEVDLGHFPFDPSNPTAKSHNRALLLKVIRSGTPSYHFLEITNFNEAYWAGLTDRSTYYLSPTTSNVDMWLQGSNTGAAPGSQVTLDLVLGNYGAANADAVVLTAQFDPALQVAGVYPAATVGSGAVTWQLPDFSTQQFGKVSLTLQVPAGTEAENFPINWQVQAVGEAFPQDNQLTTQITIQDEAFYLPFLLKNAGDPPTLVANFTTLEGDSELGMINCTAWSPCRNAASGNFLLQGYPNGTVEATWDGSTFGVKRAFLYFDTASLPDNAIIDKVYLHVYAGPYQSGAPVLNVVPSTASYPLQHVDFSHIQYISGGLGVPVTNQWLVIELNATGRTWVNRAAFTRLALVEDNDLKNNVPTGGKGSTIAFVENPGKGAYLEVRYRLP